MTAKQSMSKSNANVPIPSSSEYSLEHPQVIDALEEYQVAIQRGEKANRRAILERFPSIEEELKECLEGIEMLHESEPLGEEHEPGADGTRVDWFAKPLGDYKLLREIGRGGMGIVYEAEQLSLGRRVALKVLPFAATLDPRHLQRFKTEAQAAACLHHPNIVPVYAVGQERGVHFYAMQYIEGQSLEVAIAMMRKSSGRQSSKAPRTARHGNNSADTADFQGSASDYVQSVDHANQTGKWSAAASTIGAGMVTERSSRKSSQFRQFARLALQAAEALDHAHQLGVVHRDIKPANLLVDHQSQLWIADFGLARLEKEADLTMSGDLVGTLRYMSPEQTHARRGIIDHRTDIYSLGATLYELLTLEPVANGTCRQEILQQINLEEPRALRAIDKAIPLDLETIVLKCLSKPPGERFDTAQELADDLRRFLNDEPIRAKRPSYAARFSKWAKRHRSIVFCGVLLLVLAAFGLGVSNYLIWQEQAKTQTAYQQLLYQQTQTRNAYLAEAKQRKQAEANFRQARIILDYFTQITGEELAEFPEVQEVRGNMLKTSLDYYKDFISKSANNPDLQEELSKSHVHVAALLAEMGSKKQSLLALQRAFNIQEKLVLANPNDAELRNELTAMYQSWGTMKSGGIIRLVREWTVQKDLGLSSKQTKEIDALVKQHWEFFGKKGMKPDNSELMNEIASFTKSMARKVASVLSPKQIVRIEQINLQQRGVFAFEDARVVKHLQLDDKQRSEIKKLLDERRQRQKSPFGSGKFKGLFGRGKRPAFWNNQDDDLAAMHRQLTSGQKKAWQQLIGAKFQGHVRSFYPPWTHRSGRGSRFSRNSRK